MSRPAGVLLATVAVALGLVAPRALGAQTILGRVLDQVNEAPVGGVIVALVARTGEERVRTLTDSVGRFTITPPEAGEYILRAERFGYLETESPLLALGTEGSAPLELMLVPSPIGLEGLEISVEERAAEELSILGLSARRLGNRWIDKERIDAVPIKRDMGTILERTAQASIRVIRPENLTMGSDDMGLCIQLFRANSMGRGRCALIVLDGVPTPGPAALSIDPEAIESMAILEPIEATAVYGTIAGGGAVLVWTRRGG